MKMVKDLRDLLGDIHDCDVQLPEVAAFLEELVAEDAASAYASPRDLRQGAEPPHLRRAGRAPSPSARPPYARCSSSSWSCGATTNARFCGAARLRLVRTVTIRGVVTDTSTERVEVDLSSSQLYFNRELSWLDFNARVLELAEDHNVPPLERVKFWYRSCRRTSTSSSWCGSPLPARPDRGRHRDPATGRPHPERDPRRDPAQQWRTQRAAEPLPELDLRPALADQGIRIVGVDDVGEEERRALHEALPPPDLPGADAAGRRARPPPSRTSPTSRCR